MGLLPTPFRTEFGFERICVHAVLQEFAGEGLRTLALAYKDLEEEYFNQWKQRHHEASTELDDRDSKLDELYEEIEKDLLVGKN